jgi:hypothetical protein
MPVVIAQAFVDENSATVLALAMLRGLEDPEDELDARVRARVAEFAVAAHEPARGAVLQIFVIRRGEELLGWVRANSTPDSRSFDAVRTSIETAIGEPLQELLLSQEDRAGSYVATRLTRSSSTRACAEVAALVGMQCAWDESPVLDVTIDGERFSLRATYDGDRNEWLFESASQTRDRPDH